MRRQRVEETAAVLCGGQIMRAIVIVLDSLGIGAAPDAERYGDWGADTLGHLFSHVPELELPALFSLGLGDALSGGRAGTQACCGRARIASPGKDSMTGHWEMAGVILRQPFTMYERLPPQMIEAIEAEANVSFLGKDGDAKEPSEYWKEHAATGRPMLWVPRGESAIEIAAHEAVMPRARLYQISRVARRHADGDRIARVIARPLTGKQGAYVDAKGRHEYPMVPPRTVLNAISEAGLVVEGVGKVRDLFAGSGVTHGHAAESNIDAMETIERLWDRMHDGLIFANLADFDRHGHARDPAAYADALMEFDEWLDEFLPKVGRDDLLIITADHGNDPVFPGNGHTREEVPLLVRHDGAKGWMGTRETVADVAGMVAGYLGLKKGWGIDNC